MTEAVIAHAQADMSPSLAVTAANEPSSWMEVLWDWGRDTLGAIGTAIVDDIIYGDFGARGATELSNALFTGSAYGPGSSIVHMPDVDTPAIEAPIIEAPAMDAAPIEAPVVEAPEQYNPGSFVQMIEDQRGMDRGLEL